MLGVVMGALLAVLMTRVFLEAYPILKQNLFLHPELRETPEGAKWQSAMTFKFVGVLNTLSDDNSKTLNVMFLGIAVGVAIQIVRKILQRSKRYQAWRVASPANKSIDFALDAVIVASPYASSFGGFVDFTTSVWFGLGGIVSSVLTWLGERQRARAPASEVALPEDMSTTSLVGGGLIAGESLYALWIGLAGLIASGALGKIFGGG
jgi:hypothetical protein